MPGQPICTIFNASSVFLAQPPRSRIDDKFPTKRSILSFLVSIKYAKILCSCKNFSSFFQIFNLISHTQCSIANFRFPKRVFRTCIHAIANSLLNSVSSPSQLFEHTFKFWTIRPSPARNSLNGSIYISNLSAEEEGGRGRENAFASAESNRANKAYKYYSPSTIITLYSRHTVEIIVTTRLSCKLCDCAPRRVKQASANSVEFTACLTMYRAHDCYYFMIFTHNDQMLSIRTSSKALQSIFAPTIRRISIFSLPLAPPSSAATAAVVKKKKERRE